MVFGILSLFACQAKNNDLTFVGEGNHWSANVTVNQNEGDERYQIQLNYKGSNIEGIEIFSFCVQINDNEVGFGTTDATLNKEGIYQHKSLSSNSPSTRKEDEPVLKVEWNNSSESFTLTNKYQ